MSFVINDVAKNVGGYGYGYNYGYGYMADKKKNWWQKLFNK